MTSSYRLDERLVVLKEAPTLSSCVKHFALHGRSFDDQWHVVFGLMPNLRELDINSQIWPMDDFINALSPENSTDRDSETKTRLPLPHLHTIRLENLYFRLPKENLDVEFVEELIDLLTLRRDSGAPIEQLEITGCYHSQTEDIDLLADIVPYVEWDDWEREVRGKVCSPEYVMYM